jgi:uncharacterized protein DUF1524/excalibur calcium-binding domain-containing protein
MPGRTAVLALLALAAILGGCEGQRPEDRSARRDPSGTPTAVPRQPSAAAGESPGTARAALATLAVKGRAPKTGYDREEFGGDWTRDGGCDTRDRILRRDLLGETYAPDSHCDIVSGRLADPYTATAIEYVRDDVPDVDIDHVVALSDAWQKGAQRWTYARRVAFANDPLNLLAVDSSANRQKGDGDAATWLPPNKQFRCTYVARQIAVKRRYGAWVTPAERDALRRVLRACPREPLPKNGRARVRIRTRAPTPPAGGDVFANCDAVRGAGLAPLRRGDPAYAANPSLDRDNDGVACE